MSSNERRRTIRETARAGLLTMAAALALAGCDTLSSWSQTLGLTDDDSKPVGIGTKTDEFRRSPCACLEIRQPPADDQYRARLAKRLGV